MKKNTIKKYILSLTLSFHSFVYIYAYEIYPEVSAKIIYIAKADSIVQVGELLVSFDDRQIKAKIARAQAEFNILEENSLDLKLKFEQTQELYERLVRAKRDVELAEIAYKKAKYEKIAQEMFIKILMLELEKYQLRAPFHAQIIETPNLRNITNHHHPQLLMRLTSVH